MPNHAGIAIPLDIPAVRVLPTELTNAGARIRTITSTLMRTPCRRCGRTIPESHGGDQPRLLRHLPILGRVVYLRIRPKRFRCPWCDGHPTTTHHRDWYDPQARHTHAYARLRIRQLITRTLTDVEAKEDGTDAARLGIRDRWIATSGAWDALPPCATMGIDAIALRKGHRTFVAVVSARTPAGDR
jgi:transposase